MVQVFGAVGEWILGNTFSCALFFTYGTFRNKPGLVNKRLTSTIGTFWIVQGTSEMPMYAVGTNYSPTGNSLQGMETPEYNATVGSFPSHISYLSTQNLNPQLIILRPVLRDPRLPHLRLPHLLHPHKRLPVPGSIPACHYIQPIRSGLLPSCSRERASSG